MIIASIENATRVCGEGQGYQPLPVRDETVQTKHGAVAVMVTAWTPTPAELAALNGGASVHVRILGITPPPMLVGVGPVPEG
jgi:hypothetical protein